MMKLDPVKLTRLYQCGLWTAKMLDEAVSRGSLTEAQAAEIKTGGAAK